MKNSKIKYIIYLIVLLLVISLSAGFSALQKTLLIDDSIFNVRLQVDTRVSGSAIQKVDGNAVSNYEDYNVSKIYGNVTFSSTSSYVLYKVDLTNYGNIKTGLLKITNNNSATNYQICDSNGNNCTNNPKTAVCNGSNCTLGSTKSIYVKVTSNTTGTKQIDLDLDFEPYHTITYENFSESTTSFAKEIMEKDTYEVTLTSNVAEVGINGTGTASYDPNTNKLTVTNVTSNITLTAKYYVNDIANTSYSGTDPNNYVSYNNSLFRIITKEEISNGYGEEDDRTKIVKDSSIGQYIFDAEYNDFSVASLNSELNTTYYNSLSNTAKDLIDTVEWKRFYPDFIGLISIEDFTYNSSWLNKNQFTIERSSGGIGYHNNPSKYIKISSHLENSINNYKAKRMSSGAFVYGIMNGSLTEIESDTLMDTYPCVYLVTEALIVGGNGTRTNPYLLELKSDAIKSNPTLIKGRTVTMNGSNQELVTVSNKLGTPYYSLEHALDINNYLTDGSTTIPQATAAGNYEVYYYIPAMDGFKSKSGFVRAIIMGIRYTINYTKGENVSSIGSDNDSCRTTGTALTCNVTLPTITPNSGWENGKWNYNSNQYSPGDTFTLNSTNTGLTMSSSVTGKTYTATIYYYNGSAVTSTTRSCNVTSENSCNITLTNAITNSKGVYNTSYKGLASTTNTMETTGLTLTGNTTLYAVYSSSINVITRYDNSYGPISLFRNEYFENNTTLNVRLAGSDNSTTNYTHGPGVGNSTWVGYSTSSDTIPEYNSVEAAAASTETALWSVYQFSIAYLPGANVTSVGSSGGTCQITTSNSCSVTLPSITPSTGYTSVGWSTTNGATTGVTGDYTLTENGGTLYANAKGSTYTATFYYYNGTNIATATSQCTVANIEGNCNVSIPSVVQNSNGKYGSPYHTVASTTSVMDEAQSFTINNNTTKYYANYQNTVTRYYYSSGYKTNTIYRNEYFLNDTTIESVLTTVENGTTNYTTSRGPGSSNWLGLSTAQDTVPEYNTVSAAAQTSLTTFYTVYQFVVNFQVGANVSSIGAYSATCNVTTSDTTCPVIFPTITPNDGYSSAGWSLSNGDTAGEPALSTYTVTNNNRVFYANAVSANYQNVTTNEYFVTLSEAFAAASNNQTIKLIKDRTESSTSTIESTKTGLKLDINGKTLTIFANNCIVNYGELDIYNSSNIDASITTSVLYPINNYGTLTINKTDTKKLSIANTAGNSDNYTINNNESAILKIYDNSYISGNYAIRTSGNLEINNATITTSNQDAITNSATGNATINNSEISTTYSGTALLNYGTISINNSTISIYSRLSNYGTLNITGCNVTGVNGISNLNNGILTINGGDFTSSNQCAVCNEGAQVTINNATLHGYDGASVGAYSSGFYSNSGQTTIIDSSIYGSYAVNAYGTANITIKGNSQIIGRLVGISLLTNSVVTLGENDLSVSNTYPIVQATNTSNAKGIHRTSGTVNFYDGIIKSASGTGNALYGVGTPNMPTDYNLYKETVNGVESAFLVKPSFLMTASEVDDFGSNFLRTSIPRDEIETITFTNNLGGRTANGTTCFDVSRDEDGSVLAWVTDSDSNNLYEVTIGSRGKVYASSGKYLLAFLTNLTAINGMQYFDTSNVTDMSYMFSSDSSLSWLDVSYFNTENVTDMSYMFGGVLDEVPMGLVELSLSNFNTSKVTNMSNMFAYCYKMTSLSFGANFKTSNVTDMSEMFKYTGSIESLNFTNFDTSKVENMYLMFAYSSITSLDLRYFDTSNVKNMSYMFAYCYELNSLNISNFNTSKVTNMNRMFSQCTNLTSLDLKSFNTSNVTNMSNMFESCSRLKTIYVSNNFITSQVTSSSRMFYGCSLLEGGLGTTYSSSYIDKTRAKIDGGTSNPGYFTGNGGTLMEGTNGNALSYFLRTNIVKQDIETLTFTNSLRGHTANGTNCWDVSKDSNGSVLAWVTDTDSNGKYEMTIGANGIVYAYSGYYLFSYLMNLDSLNGMDYFDTSNVTDMSNMFAVTGFYSTVFTLELGSRFDTSQVTNMAAMFYAIGHSNTNFTLDLGGNFDTSKVTSMEMMFYSSGSLKTIYVPSSFVTTAVTNSSGMFSGCTSLVGGAGTAYNSNNPMDKTYAHIDGGTSNPGYFTSRSAISNNSVNNPSNINTSSVSNSIANTSKALLNKIDELLGN